MADATAFLRGCSPVDARLILCSHASRDHTNLPAQFWSTRHAPRVASRSTIGSCIDVDRSMLCSEDGAPMILLTCHVDFVFVSTRSQFFFDFDDAH